MPKLRPNLKLEQKLLIVYLHKEMSLETKEIMKHPDLMTNGKPIQKRTVEYWLKRYSDNGNVNSIKSTGRKRKLSQEEEEFFISYLDQNNKRSYSWLVDKLGLNFDPRTANNYGLRNGYRNKD